jgi:maleate cis-trans isomerase
MRMTSVTPEALAAMNAQGVRCAAELADAECDVLAYACATSDALLTALDREAVRI